MCSPQVESKDQSQFFNRSKCKATCGMALLSLSYSCALSLRHLVYTQPAPHPIWPLSTRPTPCLVHPQLALSFCTPYLTHTQPGPQSTRPTPFLVHSQPAPSFCTPYLTPYPTWRTLNLAHNQLGPHLAWSTPQPAPSFCTPYLTHTQVAHTQHAPHPTCPTATCPTHNLAHIPPAPRPSCPIPNLPHIQLGAHPIWPTATLAHTQTGTHPTCPTPNLHPIWPVSAAHHDCCRQLGTLASFGGTPLSDEQIPRHPIPTL